MEDKELIEKLKKEKSDLLNKINKLHSLIIDKKFSDLSSEYQFMTKMQYNIMVDYYQLVAKRIELLEKGE